MRAYWNVHIWDGLLCLLMGIGLARNVFAGYLSSDPLVASLIAVVLVTAVCMTALFFAGYNRMTTIAGIVTGVVLLLVCILYVRNSGVLGGEEHFDNSPALFWVVTVGCSAVCYLLSRSRPGMIVLFLAGVIMVAAFCFLEYPVDLPGYLAFTACAATQFCFLVYQSSLAKASSGAVKMRRYTLQSLLLVLMAMLLAAGVFLAVIRPLHPPTHELKLITKLESMEILEKIGVSTRTTLHDEDQKTEQTNEKERTVKDKEEQENTPDENQNSSSSQPDEAENPEVTEKEPAHAIRYDLKHILLYVLLALLFVAVLVSPFLLRLYFRNRWEARVRSLSPEGQALELYAFFEKRLRLAGFQRPGEVTLHQYVQSQDKLLRFFRVRNVSFRSLTEDYETVLYGMRSLEEDDLKKFWVYYEGFRALLKNRIGRLQYLLHLFQI